MAAPRELHALAGHSNVVLGVAWSPDSARLLSANRTDGTIDVWDAATGQNIGFWKGRPPIQMKANATWALAAFSAAYSPDGRRVASTREDGVVQLWDAGSGQVEAVLPAGTGNANIVAWSPDGLLYGVSTDDGTVELWDVGARRQVRALQSPANASVGNGWANAVMWSPDGRMVGATRADGTVQVWEAATGRQLAALQGHQDESWGGAWSPDGLRIASGSKDTTIRLWGVPPR